MARIAGVDLPRDKRVEIAMTYIYGIGLTSARKVLDTARIKPDTRVRDLTDNDVAQLRQVIENDYRVEGTLRGEITFNIRRLMFCRQSRKNSLFSLGSMINVFFYFCMAIGNRWSMGRKHEI